MPGTLYVVATPIGNLEDVTARALRVLREVAVIAAEDTRRTAHLLARYAITTPTTSLHEHNEARKTPAIVARLLGGEHVALVSDAGTPLISDPGRHLIQAAISEGIRIEPIPGPSAIVTALSAAGASTGTFTFLGFPPTRSKDRILWFERLSGIDHVVVFFEAPHRIRETLEQLVPIVGDCPVVVCRELTKLHEELVRGPIASVLKASWEARGEVTVVLDLGLKTESLQVTDVNDGDLYAELCQITENGASSRRKALNVLARKHRMTPNEVYEAVERAKKLAE
jgi:16S rRNA (cytidine1402-2'-O)-methyltransferase